MANVARLGVVLGMDSAEFTKGLEQAKRQIFNFQNALKGGAFAAFGAQLVRWADDLKDTADAYESTVEQVLQLKSALQQSGGSAENAGRLLGTFVNKLDEAAAGGKAAQDSLKKIGISLNDIATLGSDQLFSKTVEQLAKIDDPVRRNAAAFDVFGKAIRGVDVKKLNEELKQNISVTDAQKSGIEDAADAADMFAKSWGDLNKVTAEFIGPLAKGLAQFFEDLVDGLDRAINGIKNLLNLFDELLNKIPRLPGNGGGDEYDAALTGGVDVSTGGYTRKGGGSSGGASSSYRGGRSVSAAKDSKLDQLLKELATIQQISSAYGTTLKLQLENIQLQTQKLSMTKDEAQVAQVIYELEKKRAEQVAELEDRIAVARETGADQKVIDALNAQIAKVNELTETYRSQIVAATEAQQNFAQSFEGGLAASFQKFQFDAINTAAYVEQSVDSVFANMTSALDQFVETGKFSFSDFAKSVIQDLIKIQLRMQLTALFAKALGFASAAFSTTPGISSNPEFMGPMAPGRADGGAINAGNPYLVGENGPELVVPNRSGTVIPNNQLGGMGGPSVVYNGPYIANMQAIDTQSATQFLARNKDAVYSANMSASRSMPTSVR